MISQVAGWSILQEMLVPFITPVKLTQNFVCIYNVHYVRYMCPYISSFISLSQYLLQSLLFVHRNCAVFSRLVLILFSLYQVQIFSSTLCFCISSVCVLLFLGWGEAVWKELRHLEGVLPRPRMIRDGIWSSCGTIKTGRPDLERNLYKYHSSPHTLHIDYPGSEPETPR